MKEEYKDWFLNNIKDKEFTIIDMPLKRYGRKYEYYNFGRHEVPFDLELNSYLQDFVGDDNFEYDCYHIHRWKVGSYFSTHHDDRENRKFSYVCELQESNCKTKLLVDNILTEEGWFDVYTKHEVPPIKDGERISLTIFGKNKTKTTLM